MIVLVTVSAMLRADLDPAKMFLSSPPAAAAVTDTAAASVLPGPAQVDPLFESQCHAQRRNTSREQKIIVISQKYLPLTSNCAIT